MITAASAPLSAASAVPKGRRSLSTSDNTTTVQAVSLAALSPAPWNPRTIRDDRFANLCRSIEADPEFLNHRPILATADGTIYAGNMRYRAAQHLGMETIPAIVEDIPEQLAKERALRDNAQWGVWEEDDLAALLGELRVSGADLDLLGFDDRDLQKLLDSLANQGGLTDPDDVPPLARDRSPPLHPSAPKRLLADLSK